MRRILTWSTEHERTSLTFAIANVRRKKKKLRDEYDLDDFIGHDLRLKSRKQQLKHQSGVDGWNLKQFAEMKFVNV